MNQRAPGALDRNICCSAGFPPSFDVASRWLWHLAGILNAIGAELGKWPHPRGVFPYLVILPWLGTIADYLGECGALVRAAAAGEAWITLHANVVGSDPGQ